MTTLTLDERRERIAKDENDPDDMVYYRTRDSRFAGCYHSTPDCSHLRTEPAETTRERAQELDRAPCKLCVLDGGEQPEELESKCPFCGAKVGHLPRHLPKCDGSEGVAEVDGL